VPALCRALADAGAHVTLLTTDDNGRGKLAGPLGTSFDAGGFESYHFSRKVATYTISSQLLRWLEQNGKDYDLVHVHGVFSHVSDLAPRIAYRLQRPYGISPRGSLGAWSMGVRRPLAKRLFLRTLVGPNFRRAAFAHFTSNQELREAEACVHPAHVSVIPNGVLVPPTLGPRVDHRDGVFRLLFLSRIDPKKGLEILLEAVAAVVRQGRVIELTVAGAGTDAYVASLRVLATRLGVANRVRWVGFVDGPAKESLLAQADAFALSSRNESFGMAVAEASAAGVPVVVSDQVGIAPEIVESEAGLVVACRGEAFAGAIETLIRDPGARRRMGENGRKLVRTRYSLSATARRMLSLYERVLETWGEGRAR
jgi:glycosyltransferase involved in cell wall biosynthesis